MKRSLENHWSARGTLLTIAAAVLSLTSPNPAMAQSASNLQTPTPDASRATLVQDLYPLITTPALFEARDFYVRHFGFQVLFEASWAVYLTVPDDNGVPRSTLAFMHPNHPSNPPGPESFNGLGMILTIQVPDSAAAYDLLTADGAPIVYPLTVEPWGQRRFMTQDPAGVLIDVVQQIQPEEGYWARYPAPSH